MFSTADVYDLHRVQIEIFVFERMFQWYLVDPASSHTLNSKIKPCMSQYSLEKVKPQTAH